jgi:hypothetical protein
MNLTVTWLFISLMLLQEFFEYFYQVVEQANDQYSQTGIHLHEAEFNLPLHINRQPNGIYPDDVMNALSIELADNIVAITQGYIRLGAGFSYEFQDRQLARLKHELVTAILEVFNNNWLYWTQQPQNLPALYQGLIGAITICINKASGFLQNDFQIPDVIEVICQAACIVCIDKLNQLKRIALSPQWLAPLQFEINALQHQHDAEPLQVLFRIEV